MREFQQSFIHNLPAKRCDGLDGEMKSLSELRVVVPSKSCPSQRLKIHHSRTNRNRSHDVTNEKCRTDLQILSAPISKFQR
jgi:hypothetical protein